MTSPATAKNIICAGSTQTSGETATAGNYAVFNALASESGSAQWSFRVLQVGGLPAGAARHIAGALPLGRERELLS